MASTIGAWSYVKNDGSLSTKDDVNSNLSSTGKNKSTTNKTTLDVEQFLQLIFGRTVEFYSETGDYVIKAVGKPLKTI